VVAKEFRRLPAKRLRRNGTRNAWFQPGYANRYLPQAGQALRPVLETVSGGTIELAGRHPWELVAKYMQNGRMTEFYICCVYVVVGERRDT
jgi:hypothetical protein